MSRREQLENIIIGTLLESTENRNYYDDCNIITEDMFQIELNKRIFCLVRDMNTKGKKSTTPFDILMEYGEKVMDICADMAGLVADFSFIHLKMQYNERKYLESCILGMEPKRTNIQFVDYVKTFVTLVYS